MMVCNNLFLCLLGILASSIIDTVAIIGGYLARADQFPYQVFILRHDKVQCGGGIIGDKFILTAAHCVFANGSFVRINISIIAGTNDWYKTGESVVIRRVKKIFVPKEYNDKLNFFKTGLPPRDIAVLMLKGPLGLSRTSDHKHLKELKLPENEHISYVHKDAVIAGWGWHWMKKENKRNIGSSNDTLLRYAEATVIAECHNNILKSYFGSYATQRFICAGLKGYNSSVRQSTGYGDSGSPLVHNGIVIGVLNAAPDDLLLLTQLGSIYARVAHYLTFIKHAMHDELDDILSVELDP